MGIGSAQCRRQGRRVFAIACSTSTELAEPVTAVRLVLVDGGHDALETRVSCLTDRKAKLPVVPLRCVQSGPGPGRCDHLGAREDLDQCGFIAASLSPSPTNISRIIGW